jgi:hypothetical protein
MTRRSPLLGVVALAGVIAGLDAGCKDDPPDPAVQFIVDYCAIYQPCCVAAGRPGDGVACQALVASARSPEAPYNAPAGGDCISRLRMMANEPGFCEGEILPPSSCSRVFGEMPEGVCIQDSDCPPSDQGEARCIAGGTETPRCQIQARGAVDSAPCIGDVRGGVVFYTGTMSGEVPDLGYLCDAADMLRCDTAQTGACVALTAVGAPCVLSTDCADAAFCDANTGTCAPRNPAGSACIGQALECADGSYCDAASMTCAAQLDVGTYCTDNVQCLTGNCPDGTCQPTPTGGTNPLCGG